eukprot:CAMPEP_0174996254 /NCGR_PEP_ID=MMETSP0005-20121125/289_1 /TAXON_ID=420556 /ORGANISM="Ochromonas sp., Strain CCMP1393" /LENGTH=533 /DNA_ID=CAMNT_0016250635 /DNA_START=132 /DNA_END=1733 /DNA_ORIENTATION=+
MNANATNKKISTLQIGLTGSIGMGKSTISKQLTQLGFPVFDADLEVHKLYAPGGKAVAPMQARFPEVVINGGIDRSKLTARIMSDSESLPIVEKIVHPLVIAERQRFYEESCAAGKLLVVYDIPLLFENIDRYSVDYTIVATADEEIQRQRVMARAGMTTEKFASILAKQVPDQEKRRLADYLVHTDYPGYAEAKSQLATIIESIVERHPELWDSWKSTREALIAPDDVTQDGRRYNDEDRVSSATTGRGSVASGSVPVPAVESGSTTCTDFLKQEIDLVLFDLDDTLVPVMNQILAAYAAIEQFMQINMPNTNAVAKEQLRPLMKSVSESSPLLAHDLTEIRKRALHILASKFNEDAHVEEAMQIFVRVRSDVIGHLYDDVLPCFDWLRAQNIQIGVLTNGNADLNSHCDGLKSYLDISLSSVEIGCMKPAKLGFIACSQLTNIRPSRILYVGDSYEKDILGAKQCGMHGALLLRPDPSSTSTTVDATTTTSAESGSGTTTLQQNYPLSDVILSALHPSELEDKLKHYFSNR